MVLLVTPGSHGDRRRAFLRAVFSRQFSYLEKVGGRVEPWAYTQTNHQCSTTISMRPLTALRSQSEALNLPIFHTSRTSKQMIVHFGQPGWSRNADTCPRADVKCFRSFSGQSVLTRERACCHLFIILSRFMCARSALYLPESFVPPAHLSSCQDGCAGGQIATTFGGRSRRWLL